MGGHADVLCDLAKQGRRQIATAMHGDRGCASVRVAELDMRASLPRRREPEHFENRDNKAMTAATAAAAMLIAQAPKQPREKR